MKKLFSIIGIAVMLTFVFACSHDARWKLKGNIEGADSGTVVLEALFNGNWYPVDSATVKSNGVFEFSQPATPYPSMFRLSYNDAKAYIPVDSAETLTFSSSAASFDNGYTVAGTLDADMLTKANEMISSAGNGAATNEALKRELGTLILTNPGGLAAYYIINSTIPSGRSIFDTANKQDLRIIGAVANAYSEQRPNDPRTALIKSIYLGSRRAGLDPDAFVTDTIVANEVAFPEIVLLDENGKEQSLTEVAAQHPVLLNFTVYGGEFSPSLNVELGETYEKYKAKGLEIYQVGLDGDEFQWRQSARNLPWITVYNAPKEGINYLVQYNVGEIPTSFIINSRGELVERITDHSKLAQTVGKYL